MSKVEILYYSGYGHTKKQAEALAEGAGGRLWAISDEGEIGDEAWEALDAADAIVFGCPTYMAGPPWQMKKICDASSKRWFARKWQDKLAAGFTNSGSVNGDKGATLTYFATLAAQHGMVWASLGQAPMNEKEHGPEDRNWTGAALGAMAISPSDASPEEAPRAGDLASARDFGRRIARLAAALADLDDDTAIAAE